MSNYQVVVGNIGTVYEGGFIDSARDAFAVYKRKSISGSGRAGGEPVTLMKDGEPFEEFLGADEPEEDYDDQPIHPGCDQCQMLNINGVNCHEHGCPNKNKHWDQEREQWIAYFECPECGDQIEVGESCNCLDPVEDEAEDAYDETTICECGRKPEDCTTFDNPEGDDHQDR